MHLRSKTILKLNVFNVKHHKKLIKIDNLRSLLINAIGVMRLCVNIVTMRKKNANKSTNFTV